MTVGCGGGSGRCVCGGELDARPPVLHLPVNERCCHGYPCVPCRQAGERAALSPGALTSSAGTGRHRAGRAGPTDVWPPCWEGGRVRAPTGDMRVVRGPGNIAGEERVGWDTRATPSVFLHNVLPLKPYIPTYLVVSCVWEHTTHCAQMGKVFLGGKGNAVNS